MALAHLLTLFSGTVRIPSFAVAADGSRERAFTINAQGERVPAFVEKNKFLNARNLAQLAKDTSFIAIMAVGMSIVIIAGEVARADFSEAALMRLMAGVAAA